MPKEIKIAGAGISGLTAAINLKLTGYQVTVFEKKANVGGQHVDDWQGLENWTREEDILDFLKSINVGTDFHYHPFSEVNMYDYRGNRSLGRSETPFFYLVKRGAGPDSLDQYLRRKSENLGVKIVFQRTVGPEEVDVVATGPKRVRGLAYGIIFETGLPDNVSVIIDNNLAPQGYAYLFVADGQGVLAVAIAKDFPKIKEYFTKALGRFKELSQFKINNQREFSGFMDLAVTKRKDKIYIGEAGGFQDALWGAGIRYAFLSGYLASQAIIEQRDYWRMVRREITPWLKASIVARLIWRLLGNRNFSWLIRKTASSSRQRRMLCLAYRPSYFKKTIYAIMKAILKKYED